jgi:hypothetical protein
MYELVHSQSAISAALDMIDACTSTQELIRVSGQLAEVFVNNDVVLEYLKEQALYALDRISPKKPEMNTVLFRAIMGKVDAEA